MKRSVLALIIGSTLSGCSMFEDRNVQNTDKSNSSHIEMQSSSPLKSSLAFQKQFKQNLDTPPSSQGLSTEQLGNEMHLQNTDSVSDVTHNINYYVQGLMQDLVANLQFVNATTPVAVVSFVMLDSDYNGGSLLGNQLAESFIHEVHKYGIPVIDFKATGFIRVTEQGDFAFSKDYQDFSGDLPARYVIGGTMTKVQTGYLVNARIVGLNSKAVVASAQSFIPNEVADSIVRSASTGSPDENNVSDQNLKATKPSSNKKEMISNVQNNKIRLIGSD